MEAWLRPVLEEKNLFLTDIRFSMGRKIEVYIDSDEGIHIDDCAAISRLLEKHLDGSGLVPSNYILEVSSPGMYNPLKVPRQYQKRIGRILEILKKDGTRLVAQLIEANGETIRLREVKEEVKSKNKKKKKGSEAAKAEEPNEEYVLRYDDIKSAVLQFKL